MANMLMYGLPRPVRKDYREVFETSTVLEFHPLTHQDPCCLHLISQAHLNILTVHISLRVELPEAALNHLPAGYRCRLKSTWTRRNRTAVLGGLARTLDCVSVRRELWLHCREERNVAAHCVTKVLATELTHTERHIPQQQQTRLHTTYPTC